MNERLQWSLDKIRKLLRHDEKWKAVRRAKKLAKKYPDEPEAWRWLAFAYAMTHDLDGAVEGMTPISCERTCSRRTAGKPKRGLTWRR